MGAPLQQSPVGRVSFPRGVAQCLVRRAEEQSFGDSSCVYVCVHMCVCAYVLLKSISKTTGDEPVAHRTVDYSRNEFSLSLIVIAFPPAKGGLM